MIAGIAFELHPKSWTKNFLGVEHGRCPLFMGKAVERKDENYRFSWGLLLVLKNLRRGFKTKHLWDK